VNDNKNSKLPIRFDASAPEFDLFQSPFYLIAHADYRYHEDLDLVIQKFGLDRTTYRLLTIMMRGSPINIKDLVSLSLIKRATTSRALERMKKEGWITQVTDANDNRITNVHLSKTGRELAAKVMCFGSRQLQRAVKGLEQSQIEELVKLLNHMVSNLSKLSIE